MINLEKYESLRNSLPKDYWHLQELLILVQFLSSKILLLVVT